MPGEWGCQTPGAPKPVQEGGPGALGCLGLSLPPTGSDPPPRGDKRAPISALAASGRGRDSRAAAWVQTPHPARTPGKASPSEPWVTLEFVGPEKLGGGLRLPASGCPLQACEIRSHLPTCSLRLTSLSESQWWFLYK